MDVRHRSAALLSSVVALAASASAADWKIIEGALSVDGAIVLDGLTETAQAKVADAGVFLQFEPPAPTALHAFELGAPAELRRFAGCYRYKACWMRPTIGARVAEIPLDTQFLLLQQRSDRYVMLVPLVVGDVRCTLYGDAQHELWLLAETGAPAARFSSVQGLYLLAGADPQQMMQTAAGEIARQTPTLRLSKDKHAPAFVDYYGWCSWNAFYQHITHDKLAKAFANFKKNDQQLGFVIIDAGWQSTRGKVMTAFGADPNKFPQGLAGVVRTAKEDFGVRHVLAWHTLWGYWQGVAGDGPLARYATEAAFVTPERFLADSVSFEDVEKAATVGKSFLPAWDGQTLLIPGPSFFPFYNDFYACLRRQGVDGAKIDAMSWVEACGGGRGGRAAIMRDLVCSAQAAAHLHFDGALLNCSSCSNDFLFHALQSTVTRASMDFRPKQPETHGLHIWTNAHTGFWMGPFVLPDWDMFQAGHDAGAFHAAARAMSGGPVYSTDELGTEKFEIIRKLAFRDGRIPRCQGYARVCTDSFFVDPSKTAELVKIFNTNRFGGVIGAFNCCYGESQNQPIRGAAGPADVHGLPDGSYAVYRHNSGELDVMPFDGRVATSLRPLEFELFTVAPVRAGFAPLGLINMYNSGGAIVAAERVGDEARIELIDGGDFGAYAERAPRAVTVNGAPRAFEYDADASLLTMRIEQGGAQTVVIRW